MHRAAAVTDVRDADSSTKWLINSFTKFFIFLYLFSYYFFKHSSQNKVWPRQKVRQLWKRWDDTITRYNFHCDATCRRSYLVKDMWRMADTGHRPGTTTPRTTEIIVSQKQDID